MSKRNIKNKRTEDDDNGTQMKNPLILIQLTYNYCFVEEDEENVPQVRNKRPR